MPISHSHTKTQIQTNKYFITLNTNQLIAIYMQDANNFNKVNPLFEVLKQSTKLQNFYKFQIKLKIYLIILRKFIRRIWNYTIFPTDPCTLKYTSIYLGILCLANTYKCKIYSNIVYLVIPTLIKAFYVWNSYHSS